ncbi:hypothetical protein SAMN05444157_0591 [Frankineae bacterium MT45]|nr:hypothetical protein SAMN05444157_0591 [Frankineae bacterium MT45]
MRVTTPRKSATLRTKTLVAAGTLAVAGIAATVSAAPASAAWAYLSGQHTVCADSLTYRDSPGGTVRGTLYRGATFDIYGSSKGATWVQGDSLQYVRGVRETTKGFYVLNGYFC